jgi:serine/threonine protein kinase
VKVVWRQNFSSDRPYEREFSGIAQFEPISRSHPGVVSVLHVGRDDAAGCFFYVMELADDALAECEVRSAEPKPPSNWESYQPRTLAADLKAQGRLPLNQVLELGVQLAEALGHVHRHGLVHRDIKPSNVIFVEDQAKLADIGLVTGANEARSFVGTEGFIPPEGPGTVQADLFALGRLLYQAATGKDRLEYPDLPSDLDRWPDREILLELNEVLARACAPEPANRRANAAELALDLNLILAGRSVRRAYRVERRLKQATLTAALAAMAVLLTASAVWSQRMLRQRADARAAQEADLRQRAEQSEKLGRERLREALLQQALALSASTEPDRRARALASLRAAAQVRPGPELRNAAVAALATPELRVVRRWDAGTTAALGARPDVTLSRYLRCLPDGALSILRTTDDAELVRLPAVGRPADFGVFSPNGRWLAVKYRNSALRVWDLQARTNFPATDQLDADYLAFAPDSSSLALGLDTTDEVTDVDLPTGQRLWSYPARPGVRWLAWHPSEGILAVALDDGATVDFLQARDGSRIRRVTLADLGYGASWSRDGRQLITAQSDFSLRIWEWPKLDLPRVIVRLHRSEPIYLASDPASRSWVSGGWDNRIYWVDALDGHLLLAQPGNFVAAAVDRPAFLWARGSEWTLADFDSAIVPDTVPLHNKGKSPEKLDFSPDGKWLATTGEDGVHVLNLQSRVSSVVTDQNDSQALTFSADSEKLYLLSGQACAAYQIGQPPNSNRLSWTQTEFHPLPPGFESALAAFAPDRRTWLTLARPKPSAAWGWCLGSIDSAPIRRYRVPLGRGPAFPVLSPDGRWLAWGNWQNNGAFVCDLQGTNQPIPFSSTGSTTVAFSPDGVWFVVSDTREARFFETGSLRLKYAIARLPRGTLPATISFSGNSRFCAIVAPPDQVKLIDPATGVELVTLSTPERHAFSRAAFGQNDRLLAVSSLDYFVVLWDLEKLRTNLRTLALDW